MSDTPKKTSAEAEYDEAVLELTERVATLPDGLSAPILADKFTGNADAATFYRRYVKLCEDAVSLAAVFQESTWTKWDRNTLFRSGEAQDYIDPEGQRRTHNDETHRIGPPFRSLVQRLREEGKTVAEGIENFPFVLCSRQEIALLQKLVGTVLDSEPV